MKFAWLIFIIALLITTGCKKNAEQFGCPQIVSPANYTTVHSGDTVSVLVFLPPAIQRDSSSAFIWLSNPYYLTRLDSVILDKIFYPDFGTGNYSTIKMVLRSAKNGIDTNYIDAGAISPGGGSCKGITVYITP